jgi:DNA-binding NarL/FixJ family response regulator
LGISPKTVLNHRQNILYKLRIESGIDLTLYAERLGLLSPRERG